MAADRSTQELEANDREGSTAAPAGPRRPTPEAMLQVRASDIEPYTGLRYLSKLFRVMAIVLVLLLAAEVVTGLISQGSAALPTLLAEASKLIVSAALLWASGDLAILLIDVGHDVRAARLLLGRQAAHQIAATQPAAATGASEERSAAPEGSTGANELAGGGRARR